MILPLKMFMLVMEEVIAILLYPVIRMDRFFGKLSKMKLNYLIQVLKN